MRNPLLDPARRSDATVGSSLPSVELVRPQDCRRISEVCGSCICLLLREGCPYCARFAPTWTDYCSASDQRLSKVLLTHCECAIGSTHASKRLMETANNANGHSSFPAIVVCFEGRASVVQGFDSGCSFSELSGADGLISQTLGMTIRGNDGHKENEDNEGYGGYEDNDDNEGYEGYDDDEETPLELLEMDDDMAVLTEPRSRLDPIIELPDDELGGDCGCNADGSHDKAQPKETSDGVRVTHDVDPEEALALAKSADADKRVCMLYFTGWCGH